MEWHIALIGVVTGTAIHAIMEPTNILQKLERLNTAIKTGKIVDPAIKGIDTRAKAYALAFFVVTLFSAIGYAVASVINPSVEAALQYSVVVAFVAEIILALRVDKYHVEIEKMTKQHKKK